MAQGDVFSGITNLNSSTGVYDIRPSAGVEVVIHNIYHSDSTAVYFTDGTFETTVDTQYGDGAWLGFFFHVTNLRWLRVKDKRSQLTTWTASKVWNQYDTVEPPTPNGYYYIVTSAGGTGGTQPTWPTTPGGTVVENQVTWTCKAATVAWDGIQTK